MTAAAASKTATEAIEHGTYGGYQKCVGRPEGSCEPCRKAAREYIRQYRKDPSVREKDRFANKTRTRALERLAKEYPARFLEILDEVRGDAG